MPRRRPEETAPYHHGNVPAAVVEAALELIEEQGVEAFTLREAARRIGVTHAAVYRHYADKRALLAAIAETGFHQLADGMERSVARVGDDPLLRLEAILVAYLRFALENQARYLVMFGPRLNADGKFPQLEEAVMRALRALREPIDRGLREGLIAGRDARTVGFSAWSLSHGYAMLLLNGRIYTKGPKESEKFFRELVRPLLAGLAATGKRGR